jgi:F-type H+-transporting ATPase subunit delta
MNIAPVAYRYARSLMELALEKDQFKAAQEDMRLVADVCDENRDLRLLLQSPVVKADKKERILNSIFQGKVGPLTTGFMAILVRKGREAMLPEIAEAFDQIRKEHDGVITCLVSSAVPLDDAAKRKVTELAAAKFPGKSITLSEKVDKNLIGGVIVRIGDEQYDGSVSRRLNDLRRKFSENPYIPEI